MPIKSVYKHPYQSNKPRGFVVSRDQWQLRAEAFGNSLSSVLLQRLPVFLNEYLHLWHCSVIANYLLPYLPQDARVLDLGCGYGRISSYIKEMRPDIELIGLDFADTFCQNYHLQVASSVVCADLSKPPFKHQSFDAVVAITSLMYLPENELDNVVIRIIKLVKRSGHLLFVDPGKEYLNLASKIRSYSSPTGGVGFTKEKYLGLGKLPDVDFINSGGIPSFSIFLPVLLVVKKWPSLGQTLLNCVRRIDQVLFHYSRWSLHRWLLLRRR